jgi:hypothetical protein
MCAVVGYTIDISFDVINLILHVPAALLEIFYLSSYFPRDMRICCSFCCCRSCKGEAVCEKFEPSFTMLVYSNFVDCTFEKRKLVYRPGLQGCSKYAINTRFYMVLMKIGFSYSGKVHSVPCN